MPIMRVVFIGALAFIGAVAIFLGAVVMLTSWQSGAIELSYTQAGRAVNETVTRLGDSARFWRLFSLMGIAPFVLGGAAVTIGVRLLRQPPTGRTTT